VWRLQNVNQRSGIAARQPTIKRCKMPAMISRRSFAVGLALAALPLKSKGARGHPATVVITADVYSTACGPLSDILSKRGMVGTAYFDPFRLGKPGLLSIDDLHKLKQIGWEIAPYAYGQGDQYDVNMVAYSESKGRNAADERLHEIADVSASLGFRAVTIAASQRKWSPELAEMAARYFKGVRVASNLGFDKYPLREPCNLVKGAFNSWNASTTAADICRKIDEAIEVGGLLPFVLHKIGDEKDTYMVKPIVVGLAANYLQKKRRAGRVRVCTMEQALTPPV
jgi:hypothetical protein